MTFLEKYIWVVNTLSHAGEKGLSLKELNEKWLLNEDPVMANQSPDSKILLFYDKILSLSSK